MGLLKKIFTLLSKVTTKETDSNIGQVDNTSDCSVDNSVEETKNDSDSNNSDRFLDDGVEEIKNDSDSNIKKVNSYYVPPKGDVTKRKSFIQYLVHRGKELDFFAIDFETTGLDRENDRIVEIGLVRFSGNTVISEFSTLVKPGMAMPKEATAINHITDSMLKKAPREKLALIKMLEFIDKESTDDILLCAHNASFDVAFLTNALERYGFSLNFSYIDTYKNSRKIIPGLKDYKLATVAKHFGVINDDPHRAAGDAKVSGLILSHLIQRSIVNQQIQKEKTSPRVEEQAVCAFIYLALNEAGKDLSLLRFYRNSSNYVVVEYIYTLFKFKFAKQGRYVILPTNAAIASGLPTEDATMSEGGADDMRTYFNAPSDLQVINEFIIESYDRAYEKFLNYKEYCSTLPYYENDISNYCNLGLQLNHEMAQLLVESAKDMKSISQIKLKLKPSFDERLLKVNINPCHNRVPLTKIRNLDDWNTGIHDGYSFWEQGEKYRKSGDIKKAIDYFDEARFNGFCVPDLYKSYAMAFHITLDYDNEIDILNEGIERLEKRNEQTGQLITRRNKAIKLLIKQRERE